MTTGEWFLSGATIFLGLIAAGAIVANFIIHKRNIAASRRIQDEDIDREHKRLTFREILDWVKRGIGLFSEYQRGVANRSERKALETRLRSLWVERDAIVIAAGELNNELAEKEVKKAGNKLEDYFINITGGVTSTKPTAEECEKTFVLLLGILYDLKILLKV